MTTIHYLVTNNHSKMQPLLIPGQNNSYKTSTSYDPFTNLCDVPRVPTIPNQDIIKFLLPPLQLTSVNQSFESKKKSPKKNKCAKYPKFNMTVASPAKRKQRSGPSCNYCRVKKTKCDAEVTVLLQDRSIVKAINEKLYHILTREEQKDILAKISKQHTLSEETLTACEEGSVDVVKQLDKIIMLDPCSCCCKIRNRVEIDEDAEFSGDCTFANGLTRKDITAFSNILQCCPDKKSIEELDIYDYEKAGYIL